MSVVAVSRIVGTFLGYSPGFSIASTTAVSGSRSVRSRSTSTGSDRVCRIVFDRERHWIDVEGTSGVAEVRRYVGRRWAGAGAC